MKFVVLFEDHPGVGPDLRATHLPRHLAFLERHSAAVEAAGPLAEPGGSPAGGLWVVEAGSEAEVRTLVETDPFWPSGLRKSVRVLEWAQVFANGRRLARL